MKKLLILTILLAGVCFAGSDLEIGGDIYLLDGNWIGLGSDKGRISFEEDFTPWDIDVVYIQDADWGGSGVSASGYTPSIFSTKDAEFTKYIMMHYFESTDQAIIAYDAETFLVDSNEAPVFSIESSTGEATIYGDLQVYGDVYTHIREGGTEGLLYGGASETLVVTLEDTGDAVFSGSITVTEDYAVVADAVGAWEVDVSDDLMPVTGSFNDPYYDLDSNGDLMPTLLVHFVPDTSGDLMPTS